MYSTVLQEALYPVFVPLGQYFKGTKDPKQTSVQGDDELMWNYEFH